jgi:hypothetical protein
MVIVLTVVVVGDVCPVEPLARPTRQMPATNNSPDLHLVVTERRYTRATRPLQDAGNGRCQQADDAPPAADRTLASGDVTSR